MKKENWIVLLLFILAAGMIVTRAMASGADVTEQAAAGAAEESTEEEAAPQEREDGAESTAEDAGKEAAGQPEQGTAAEKTLKTPPCGAAEASVPENDETGLMPGRTAAAFQQTDARWKDVPYGYGDKRGRDRACLGTGGTHGLGSGCGILAFVNAVYHLNRQFIEPSMLAEYAVAHHFRADGVGTLEGLVKSFCDREGEAYGIIFLRKASKLSRIRDDLAAGAVAVAHLKGHYVAVVDYDSATGLYLVLDSAAAEERETLPDGIRWMKEGDFTGAMALKDTDGCLQVFGTADRN